MAIGTPTVLADGTNSTDLTSYTVTVPTPHTAGRQLFLSVYSGRTTADAVQPSSVTGTGITANIIDSTITNGGNLAHRAYYLTGTLTGNLTLNYSLTMGSVGWILVEVPGVDTTTPVVQSVSNNVGTLYNAISNGKISGTFPAAVTAGSAVLSFASVAASTAQLDPLTAGLTEISGDAGVTGPSIHTGAAYSPSPTGTTFEWYGDTAALKSIINIEMKAGTVADPWTYRKFVRIG